MNAEKPVENRANTISLADEEAVRDVLANTVIGLWDIVNNLTRLLAVRVTSAPRFIGRRWDNFVT